MLIEFIFHNAPIGFLSPIKFYLILLFKPIQGEMQNNLDVDICDYLIE